MSCGYIGWLIPMLTPGSAIPMLTWAMAEVTEHNNIQNTVSTYRIFYLPVGSRGGRVVNVKLHRPLFKDLLLSQFTQIRQGDSVRYRTLQTYPADHTLCRRRPQGLILPLFS